MSNFLYQLASPKHFYSRTSSWIPWLTLLCLFTLSYGLYAGLFLAPADYQQGEGYRIIYIHVPAAILSLFSYLVMAGAAASCLIWRVKLGAIFLRSIAPLGTLFTAMALVTGSLWGKPMWGTWWIWDARLTSELILLFIYLAIIGVYSSTPNQEVGTRGAAILTLVGTVNLPVIHFSVNWWSTLHQGSTITRFAKPLIASSMLYPLLAMIAGFVLYFFLVMIIKSRHEILMREEGSAWVQTIVRGRV